MLKIPVDWLLAGEPWVEYLTRRDLLGENMNEPAIRKARLAILEHTKIQTLIAQINDWPGSVLKRHNDASHLLHRFTFLAETGFSSKDNPGLQTGIQKILDTQSTLGPFQVILNISFNFGGSGLDELGWMLCDAPILLYALQKIDSVQRQRVQASLEYLVNLIRSNGWPCAVAPGLGKFRGPGRKDDLCPYATLLMLKALAQFPDWLEHPVCKTGVTSLLNLWDQRANRRPYLFAMGTDFLKLKAPLIWYDILHVLDTLSQFPWLSQDIRLFKMAEIVIQKADSQSCFTPESVWTAWKDWDFGQKREPSRWLILLVHRIMQRLKI